MHVMDSSIQQVKIMNKLMKPSLKWDTSRIINLIKNEILQYFH